MQAKANLFRMIMRKEKKPCQMEEWLNLIIVLTFSWIFHSHEGLLNLPRFMLSSYILWAGRALYRAIPGVTQKHLLFGLIWKKVIHVVSSWVFYQARDVLWTHSNWDSVDKRIKWRERLRLNNVYCIFFLLIPVKPYFKRIFIFFLTQIIM